MGSPSSRAGSIASSPKLSTFRWSLRRKTCVPSLRHFGAWSELTARHFATFRTVYVPAAFTGLFDHISFAPIFNLPPGQAVTPIFHFSVMQKLLLFLITVRQHLYLCVWPFWLFIQYIVKAIRPSPEAYGITIAEFLI